MLDKFKTVDTITDFHESQRLNMIRESRCKCHHIEDGCPMLELKNNVLKCCLCGDTLDIVLKDDLAHLSFEDIGYIINRLQNYTHISNGEVEFIRNFGKKFLELLPPASGSAPRPTKRNFEDMDYADTIDYINGMQFIFKMRSSPNRDNEIMIENTYKILDHAIRSVNNISSVNVDEYVVDARKVICRSGEHSKIRITATNGSNWIYATIDGKEVRFDYYCLDFEYMVDARMDIFSVLAKRSPYKFWDFVKAKIPENVEIEFKKTVDRFTEQA